HIDDWPVSTAPSIIIGLEATPAPAGRARVPLREGHCEPASREGLRDAHLMLGAFVVRMALLVLRRAHDEASGRHNLPLRAIGAILEPLRLARAGQEPAALGV